MSIYQERLKELDRKEKEVRKRLREMEREWRQEYIETRERYIRWEHLNSDVLSVTLTEEMLDAMWELRHIYKEKEEIMKKISL